MQVPVVTSFVARNMSEVVLIPLLKLAFGFETPDCFLKKRDAKSENQVAGVEFMRKAPKEN